MVVSGVSGCKREESVRQYSVPKTAVEGMPKPTRVPAGPLLSGANAWFFKLMGPSDSILKEVPAFTGMVRSMEFSEDGTPSYQVPEGWAVSNGPPPRYQTLKLADSNPPLEITLSTLPVMGEDVSKYLLENINRWRGQLNQKPYDEKDWIEHARAEGEVLIVPVNSRLVAMVNLTGEATGAGPARMLAAIIINGSANLPETVTAPAKAPITFTLPEGWKELAGNTIRLLSLAAETKDGKVDVSVTRLGGGGEALSNLNRWRGEVNLEPIKEEDLKSHTTDMEIDGKKAVYVEAIGKEKATLAVLVPDGDSKWFFKAMGPTAAIDAEREHFKQFLKTIKFQTQP